MGQSDNRQKNIHAFQKFNSDLKTSNFMPVLFMFGAEQYLVKWAVESLVKKYIAPGASAIDYLKIDDEDSAVDNIVQACDTFSICSKKRIVWVKDYKPLGSANVKGFTSTDAEKLIEYVKSPNEGTILILSTENPDKKSELSKELLKICECYNFEKLGYSTIEGFVLKRFRNSGVEIRKDVLKYFIDSTGYFNRETEYRLFNFENDIKKIVAHSDGLRINHEDVEAAVNGDLEKYVFIFLDSLCENRKDKAFSLMHNMLSSGVDELAIVHLLIGQFELILEVKQFKDDGCSPAQMKQILNQHEFRIKKALGFCERFSEKKLKEILVQLYEIDRNKKNGKMVPQISLELLVGRI